MDLDAFLAELAAWAEERDPGWETVRYGDDPDQVADVRRSGDRTAVVLHGGFWRPRFTRANTRAVAVDLARRGWTTWNVEYRRTGVADTLADVEAALRLAGSGRVPPTSTSPSLSAATVCIGHSAGGHLALWAAGTGLVDRVVALAAVGDLARAAREGIGGGGAVEFAGPDPPAWADPMRRLPLRVPALLVHGSDDDRVPVDYSRAFAAAAGAELLELPGAGHFEPIDPRTPEWAQVAARLDA